MFKRLEETIQNAIETVFENSGYNFSEWYAHKFDTDHCFGTKEDLEKFSESDLKEVQSDWVQSVIDNFAENVCMELGIGLLSKTTNQTILIEEIHEITKIKLLEKISEKKQKGEPLMTSLTVDSKPEFIGQVVDVFEDYLMEKKIRLENSERDEAIERGDYDSPEEAAIIYGGHYDIIGDVVSNIIEEHDLTQKPFKSMGIYQHQIKTVMDAFYELLGIGGYDEAIPEEDKISLKHSIRDIFENWGLVFTMDIKKSYETIREHMFMAYRLLSESETIIIMSDSIEEAQKLANKYFGYSEESGKTFVAVHKMQQTENANIFTME